MRIQRSLFQATAFVALILAHASAFSSDTDKSGCSHSLLDYVQSPSLLFGDAEAKCKNTSRPTLEQGELQAAESISESYKQSIQPLFQKKCAECHDSSSKAPVYGDPGGELNPVQKDMEDARAALDIHEFPFGSRGNVSQTALLHLIKGAAQAKTMPPEKYTFFHRGSNLSKNEIDAITTWADKSLAEIHIHKLALGISDDEENEATHSNIRVVQLPSPVKTILQNQCTQCHRDDGAAGYVFGSVLDFQHLADKGIIIPGDGKDSQLVKSIEAGRMPMGGSKLSSSDINQVSSAIDHFKGIPVATPCASEANLEQEALDDLLALPENERRNTRYISLGVFSSGGIQAIRTGKFNVEKALNSVTWADHIITPPLVGREELLLRLDIGELAWKSSDWDAIQQINHFIPAQSTDLSNQFLKLTSSRNPVIRGDVFADIVLQSPIYERLLTLESEAQLERLLQIDVNRDISEGRVIRSGFLNSGVSLNNRVVERHATRFGAYWISYDFLDSDGEHNIFSHPTSFQRNGGEIIFNLANGMQAYMLVNKNGDRLDKAPIQIVSDPERPDRAVQNGISCIRCHAYGMLDNPDQIRAHVNASPNSYSSQELEEVNRLYISSQDFSKQINDDSRRYLNALDKIDEKQSAQRPPKDTLTVALQRFEGNVDISEVACELGSTLDQLNEALGLDQFARKDLSVLKTTKQVPRDILASDFSKLSSAISSQKAALTPEQLAVIQKQHEADVQAATERAAAEKIVREEEAQKAREQAKIRAAAKAEADRKAEALAKTQEAARLEAEEKAQALAKIQAAKEAIAKAEADKKAAELAKIKEAQELAAKKQKEAAVFAAALASQGSCSNIAVCIKTLNDELSTSTTTQNFFKALNSLNSGRGNVYILSGIDKAITDHIQDFTHLDATPADYSRLSELAVRSETKTAVFEAAARKFHDTGSLRIVVESSLHSSDLDSRFAAQEFVKTHPGLTG